MKKKHRLAYAFALCLCASFFSTACRHKAIEPKPMGYFRIDLPKHQYAKKETSLPFSFEQSTISNISIKPQSDGTCWIDLDYPQLNATFRFTYFQMKNADSLRNFIIEEERMVKYHYQKADDVEYSVIRDPEAHLWGQTYDIVGKDVATPFIFWMTDSAQHFVRSTLYFNFTPNNDSLEPVIQYLREDAMHLISTFKWEQ